MLFRSNCRSAAHDGDAVFLDTTEDLSSVDLAQHNLRDAHRSHGVGHSPAVAVKHWQGVEIHIAIVDAGVPPENGRVGPQIAVSHLHALGPRRGAAGVVDCCCGVLVWLPCFGLDPHLVQRIRVFAGDEEVRNVDVAERVLEIRVNDQNFATGVRDDVVNLRPTQPEVDRHGHPYFIIYPKSRLYLVQVQKF